jgi:hypothetical protein
MRMRLKRKIRKYGKNRRKQVEGERGNKKIEEKE